MHYNLVNNLAQQNIVKLIATDTLMMFLIFFFKFIFKIIADDLKACSMSPLLYNLRVYIQIFSLVGGTSRRRVFRYKSEYLYIHEYLYHRILVS